jgi:hypothetical protein
LVTNNPLEITITWSNPNPNCSPPISYNLYHSNDNITFNVITGILSSPYQFIPSSYNTYYFYMSSVNNLGESNYSSTITANIILFTITVGSYTTTASISGSTTTYNIVINPGISTLSFNVLPDSSEANFQLIGGGGGGGGCWGDAYSLTLYSGAGGGGGGNLLVNDYIVSVSNSYTITVGYGGLYGLSNDGFGDDSQTAGSPGQNSSITDTNMLNLIAYGGAGGGRGTSNSISTGGIGGSFLTNVSGSGGLGGNGGNGNGGSSGDWKKGTSGTNGYFYDNQGLPYNNLSSAYPTYYRPDVPNYIFAENQDSITLTNWYTVSGGGGAGNSDETNQFVSGNGGSGEGSGGLDGSNWSTMVPIVDPPPYGFIWWRWRWRGIHYTRISRRKRFSSYMV